MKTILITGATGDIGKAITLKLSEEGYNIIAIVRNKKAAIDLTKIQNVELVEADITNKASLEAIEKSGPQIDWLIASHGYIDTSTDIETQSPEAIEETFKVNIISLFYLTQVFLKRISMGMVFISSTSGIQANGKVAAYSASKAAVNSLSVALARNRSDKTFISVCPGPTAGQMREKIGAKGGQSPREVAVLVSQILQSDTYKSGDIVTVRDGKSEIVSRLS